MWLLASFTFVVASQRVAKRRVCGGMCEQGVLSTCVYVGVRSWGVHLLKKGPHSNGGTEANKASDVTQWALAW